MGKMPAVTRCILMCLTASVAAGVAAAQDELRLQPDGYALVQGTVLENLRGCERDLPCALRLRVQGREVQLLYHLGEGAAACPETLVRQGLAVAPGARVQARGRHRLAGAQHLVDLCSAPDSYLRVAPRR